MNGLTNEHDYDHEHDYDDGRQTLRSTEFDIDRSAWLEPVIVIVIVIVVVLVLVVVLVR